MTPSRVCLSTNGSTMPWFTAISRIQVSGRMGIGNVLRGRTRNPCPGAAADHSVAVQRFVL
jgi:hypothetical protein